MTDLTNIFARSIKDLTLLPQLPNDLTVLDQVKIPVGNLPVGLNGCEALTVKQIKDIATVDIESKVEVTLSNLSTTANKFYPTLSEANNHLATMSVNDVVTIGEEANKGLWYKATEGATTLTKSAYDPLAQANNYTNNKANAAKTEAVAIANNYTDLVFDAIPAVIAPYVAQAEAAATAATISAGVFETPEAGVDPTTGVADGAYFNVRSSSDESYVDEYQNIGGVPTPSGKSYPSSAFVEQLSERVEDLSAYTAQSFILGKTYLLNERVQLENGDIVKSTIPDNTNDPNVDMVGWINIEISIKKSVAEMLAINNPKDGQTIRTLSYHAGLSKGSNKYRYEPSRQLENDGGSVLNGWVVQDKTALTVWDFGYKLGDDDVSRTALSKALISTMPLRLVKETLSAHIGVGAGKDVLSQTITQNKLIFGQGRDVSVINGLRLQSQSDVLLAKDFSINANGLNYAIFVSAYDFILIDNFSSKGNLDAVLIMHGKSAQSKALVRNGYSENSNRIGFTSDVGAKNVTFENCRSFNCRQGFHAEEMHETTFIDCIADACGNDAMPPIPDYQPPEYAGGFRLHKYSGVKLIRCKNINKNGTNRDQLGGGGTNLYIEKCEGLNFLADFGATETYRDIEVKGLKDGGIALESFSPKVAGRIIVHDFDGGSLELASRTIDTVNVVTYAEFVNIRADRLQIASQANDATIHMHNIFVRSPYFNSIKGFTHYIIGDLTYSWDNSDDSHYPNLGFRFESTKAKTFTIQSFRSTGANGGSHLSIENFPSTCKPVITTLVGERDVYDVTSNVALMRLSSSALKTTEVSTMYLSQASDAINTQNKYLGRDVYNPVISKFMKATGSAPTSTWVSLDGATRITPV